MDDWLKELQRLHPYFKVQSYGKRSDGTNKWSGYLGEIQRPDGGVMTEYSVGVPINGKEMDVPTLVPTLSRNEVEQLRSIGSNDPLPLSILKKAISHAEQRVTQGKSPFAGIEDVDTASSIPYNEQMRLKQFAQQMQLAIGYNKLKELLNGN